MSVIPFPEPEPERPASNFDALGDLFGIFPMSLLGQFIDLVPDDLTCEAAWNQVKEMPLKPILKEVFGDILGNDEGETK